MIANNFSRQPHPQRNQWGLEPFTWKDLCPACLEAPCIITTCLYIACLIGLIPTQPLSPCATLAHGPGRSWTRVEPKYLPTHCWQAANLFWWCFSGGHVIKVKMFTQLTSCGDCIPHCNFFCYCNHCCMTQHQRESRQPCPFLLNWVHDGSQADLPLNPPEASSNVPCPHYGTTKGKNILPSQAVVGRSLTDGKQVVVWITPNLMKKSYGQEYLLINPHPPCHHHTE